MSEPVPTFEAIALELEAIRVAMRGVLLAMGAAPAGSGASELLDATERLAGLIETQLEMVRRIESLSKGIQ